MPLYADFHIHSKYARAVSVNSTLENLAKGAETKGLNILGTGDFTHPLWFKEIKEKLSEIDNSGIYELTSVKTSTKFMLTTEVATFDSFKRVHHVVHVPNMENVQQLNDVYSKRGNLAADGRPMLGKTSCVEFVEMTKQACKEAEIVPAHAWTPWFGILGDKSGYNSIQEAYGDKASKVVAAESGMSADPGMMWRVSSLDSFAIMSNSDPHSPYPWRLGRECNAFSDDCDSFAKIFDAVRKQDANKFLFTVETSPSYGKYHVSGHRACGFSCSFEEAKRLKEICPKCSKPLTIGVEKRIEELADRPEGFKRKNAIPFRTVLPLAELIAAVHRTNLYSKKVQEAYGKLIAKFGNEFRIVFDASEAELKEVSGLEIARVVMLNRDNLVKITPGFDGEYGVLQLPEQLMLGKKREKKEAEISESKAQKSLAEY
ncbi:MAG: endonuclease Q family protein [Candidatus Micrarchaeota archaeon]|nr:endonuclease Q family protein [Candidatus Micrarchaeota archaeon]